MSEEILLAMWRQLRCRCRRGSDLSGQDRHCHQDFLQDERSGRSKDMLHSRAGSSGTVFGKAEGWEGKLIKASHRGATTLADEIRADCTRILKYLPGEVERLVLGAARDAPLIRPGNTGSVRSSVRRTPLRNDTGTLERFRELSFYNHGWSSICPGALQAFSP
jgi:hypothetical protein